MSQVELQQLKAKLEIAEQQPGNFTLVDQIATKTRECHRAQQLITTKEKEYEEGIKQEQALQAQGKEKLLPSPSPPRASCVLFVGQVMNLCECSFFWDKPLRGENPRHEIPNVSQTNEESDFRLFHIHFLVFCSGD